MIALAPTPQLAPPVLDAGRYVLSVEGASLEVDPALGGRITALRAAGRNLLTGPEVDAVNWGSTFWTSPQSQWGWPPLPEIDSAAYVASVENAILVMRGPTSPALGVAVEKRFAADLRRGVFVLEYRIANRGAAVAQMAPWEITRVGPGGLTFYPTGSGRFPPSNLGVTEQAGVTWFPYAAAAITGHQKLFADGGEGWIAHLDGDLVLVKTFAAVPRAAHAPGEAQIEIYASPGHGYVEVEEQGACETILPGETLTWRVEWMVGTVPAAVAREAGSVALAAFVRALIGDR